MSSWGKMVIFWNLFSTSNDAYLVVSINIPAFGFNFITCFAFRLVSEADDGKSMPLAKRCDFGNNLLRFDMLPLYFFIFAFRFEGVLGIFI